MYCLTANTYLFNIHKGITGQRGVQCSVQAKLNVLLTAGAIHCMFISHLYLLNNSDKSSYKCQNLHLMNINEMSNGMLIHIDNLTVEIWKYRHFVDIW